MLCQKYIFSLCLLHLVLKFGIFTQNGQINCPVFSVFIISSSLGYGLLAQCVGICLILLQMHVSCSLSTPSDHCLTPCSKDGIPLPALPSAPQKMSPKMWHSNCKCHGRGQWRFTGRDILQPGEAGEGRNPDCICTSNCPRFKA